MKMTNFLIESLYQVITLVFIALAIGSIFYFLSKGNTRGVLWSSVGLVCFVTILIGIVGDHYFFRSDVPAVIPNNERERPYVFIAGTYFLKPLAAGDRPVLRIVLKNSGPIEANGVLKNLSYSWTPDASMQSFPYYESTPVNFSLAPTAETTVRFSPNLVLTDEIFKALTESKVRMLFYARGEYRDARGRTYPLQFCRQYDNEMPGHLINCADGIIFEDAEKSAPKPENKPPN
jgi:hypothetical protein